MRCLPGNFGRRVYPGDIQRYLRGHYWSFKLLFNYFVCKLQDRETYFHAKLLGSFNIYNYKALFSDYNRNFPSFFTIYYL